MGAFGSCDHLGAAKKGWNNFLLQKKQDGGSKRWCSMVF